jgi:hypothetical protein
LPIDEILKKLEGLEKREGSWKVGKTRDENPVHDAHEGQKKAKTQTEPVEPTEPSSMKVGEPSMEPQRDDRSSEEAVEGGESSGAQAEVWKQLVSFARARSPILGSFLAFGDLISLVEEAWMALSPQMEDKKIILRIISIRIYPRSWSIATEWWRFLSISLVTV